MKRIRCPKCGNPIIFDEKKYAGDEALGFTCPSCGGKFAIRLGASKLRKAAPAEPEEAPRTDVGCLVVIENKFHYKQIIPLQMGDNVIGRRQRGVENNCEIHTDDPSVDITHCHIMVSRDKKGRLRYVLRDGPSNTGTFVDNEILADNERRNIDDGTLFTIGATSIILRTRMEEDEEGTAAKP